MAEICPEFKRTSGGAAPRCRAGDVCETFCYRLRCDPAAPTVYTGFYKYTLSADCVKSNETWTDAAGGTLDPDELYKVECIAVAAPTAPPDPACPCPGTVPLTLAGETCEGLPLSVAGFIGTHQTVVQAAGTVFSVKICDPSDSELVRRCDPTTGDEILLQYDVSTTPPTFQSATNITTNTPYTGAVSALIACDTPAAACVPTISSAFANDLSTLLPGTTISIQKPNCCVLRVTTSVGSFLVSKTAVAYSTSEFNCPVTVTGVTVVSGTCDLASVIVTTQNAG